MNSCVDRETNGVNKQTPLEKVVNYICTDMIYLFNKI